MERSRLNFTTGDLDVMARLAGAQREVGAIASGLLNSRTSKRADREDYGRRLNAVRASLRTVECRLTPDER